MKAPRLRAAFDAAIRMATSAPVWLVLSVAAGTAMIILGVYLIAGAGPALIAGGFASFAMAGIISVGMRRA